MVPRVGPTSQRQWLEILFGGLTEVAVVPSFINSAAPPFTPVHRVRALGEVLGRYLSGLPSIALGAP